MADLLKSAKLGVSSLSQGQKVRGKVVSKNATSLILDIGAKSEGIVAEKAFAEARDFISKLNVGDEITATVIFPETRDGSILLSLRDAISSASWEKLLKAQSDGLAVVVLAKIVTNSGISVDAEGVSGFIPSSQLGKEASKEPQNLVGKYFKAKVIEIDRQKNKLVLSEKEVSEAEDIKNIKNELEKLKIGDVFDGKVTTVANFGCFVEIVSDKTKLEGLVHVSELAWSKVSSPQSFVKVGDKVKVSILGVKAGKLALSIKQAQADPWGEVEKKFKKDDKVSGTVVKQTDFGVFVELEPGIEGLVHITKIPPAKKFEAGETVNCYIEEVDAKKRKISLGLVLTSIPVGYK